MTVVFIVLLSLLLLALVAAPLLSRTLVDPLPDFRDPVTVDLEEERDALLRAIRELDLRGDLADSRREELRTRYEAKAAKVLRLLDERSAGPAPEPKPAAATPRRAPWGGVLLAVGFVAIGAALGGWILPRTGQANVTSSFGQDIDSARQLQALRKAAATEPNEENLLALGELEWQLGDADAALATYTQAVDTLDPVPAQALKRLGLLQLGLDPEAALPLLEQAVALAPTDAEALFYLGELQLLFGQFSQARESLASFTALPEAEGDERSRTRLAALDQVLPLYDELAEQPSVALLTGIGDIWWAADERELAVDAYFRVLTDFDPLNTVALSRTGQVMFASGRLEDAMVFLERAVTDPDVDPEALLFLGNGKFSQGEFEAAIAAWERYLTVVGPEEAGRVPGLIEQARAQLDGADAGGAAPALSAAQDAIDAGQLFAANCASCHGSQATGGTGPALAGNARVADPALVSNTIRFGRGSMPGFLATLTPAEIGLLVDFVTEELAGR